MKYLLILLACLFIAGTSEAHETYNPSDCPYVIDTVTINVPTPLTTK